MSKPYDAIEQDIREKLEMAVESDPYGLSPETLYRNISGTLISTSPEKTAEIFEVPYSLVLDIQKENQQEES